MVTADELAALESIVTRARAAAGTARAASAEPINVGDVVQLRPGADTHWETSLLLVGKVRADGRISGAILRGHRSGLQEAWYTYTAPEVERIGRMAYPPPGKEIRSQAYLVWCPKCMGRG